MLGLDSYDLHASKLALNNTMANTKGRMVDKERDSGNIGKGESD